MKSSFYVCALLVLGGAASSAHAQVITNGEIERGLRWGGRNASFDGEPYTQRYSYSTGMGMVYINGDSRQLRYLDYLDRADRANKFGYPMPIDPYFELPPQPQPVYEAPRGVLGFGIFGGHWRR